MAKDIYRQIITGGINVIYEPPHYELSSEMVNELLAGSIKRAFSTSECPTKPAPAPVWWFEFIRYLIDNKDQYEYFTIIMDEAHEVIPGSSRGDLWHLIDKFASKTVIEMRKKYFFFPATHRLNLIDYRVNQRMNFSGFPVQCFLRVFTGKKVVVQNLQDGYVIVERAQRAFGYLPFGRIPKQSPIVQVEGMTKLF